jgi:hypothetical protein
MNTSSRFSLLCVCLLAALAGLSHSWGAVAQLGTSKELYQSTAGATHTLTTVTVPAGTDRLLVVTASHTNYIDVSSVTFNGTAMTKAIEKDDTFVAVDTIWVLPMGSSASATVANVVATFATIGGSNGGTGLESFISAVTFSGVNQTTPVSGALSANTLSGTNLGSSLNVTSATGDLVFAIYDIYSQIAASMTAGGGQTQVSSGSGAITGLGLALLAWLSSIAHAQTVDTAGNSGQPGRFKRALRAHWVNIFPFRSLFPPRS